MNKFLYVLIISAALISSATAQNQYENGGFEQWEEVVNGDYKLEPVDWSSIKTSDSESYNEVAPVVWGKSDDAHSGNSSVYLFNKSYFAIVVTGSITNGRVHTELPAVNSYMYTDPNDDSWNSIMGWRPDSVVGWYKSNPMGDDFGTVKVALHTGELHLPQDESDAIALAYLELPKGVTSEWTRFSTPIVYYSNEKPEYQLTILTAGNGLEPVDGSEIWFDDLQFIYNNNSIDDNLAERMNVFSYQGKINISISGSQNEFYKIVVSDIMGRQLYLNKNYKGEKLVIQQELQSGIYFISATKGQQTFTKKIFIN